MKRYLVWFEYRKGIREYATTKGAYTSGGTWSEDITKAYRFTLEEAFEAYKSRDNTVVWESGVKPFMYQIGITRDLEGFKSGVKTETTKEISQPKAESWFDRL